MRENDSRPDVRIESRDNAALKLARAVRDGRRGAADELMFVEGVRLCEEATRAELIKIETVFYAEELLREPRAAVLIDALRRRARRTFVVGAAQLASISDTKTPQGVVALAARLRDDAEHFANRISLAGGVDNALCVILHRVSNPANAGSILRVAEAAGASGVIATKGTVDLFSPKAVRGAMGSAFRLPAWLGATFGEVVAWCAERRLRVVTSDASAVENHTAFDWTQPTALVVGEEGGGLSAEEIAAASASVRIPMREPVESLNVAVACGVLLYEAARQRAGGK